MLYVYYPKILKEQENILLSINQKNTEYQVKVFEKKCIYFPTYFTITASVPTTNPITASVTSAKTVTASISTNI